jgi:hypothetical protein
MSQDFDQITNLDEYQNTFAFKNNFTESLRIYLVRNW